MPPSLNIAIIGAGPAGCMLARLLLRPKSPASTNISVTVFEAEASLDFRSQGGTLDLHDESGQHALKAAGLFDEFQKFARYDGEAFKIADKNLLCYINESGGKPGKSNGRPEIDRPQLRKILYDALPDGTVRWGHKLIRIDEETNALYFANGHVETAVDLIVGADGAFSKVRPRLSDAKPYYSGIGGHALRIPDAQRTHPELYDLVNRGSLFAFSDAKSIMAQQMSDGSLHMATWAARPAGWQQDSSSGYDAHDSAAVRAAWAQEYADWDPRLQAYLHAADDDDMVPRDLFMLPIGHHWPHVKGVTLIGDAAHLATPFAGEGVNIALLDSEKLAGAILAARGDAAAAADLDARVAAFEQDMFRRGKAMQQLTWDMLSTMYFTPGAPRSRIEKYVCTAIGYGMNPILMFFIRPMVYIWFFFFKLRY